MLVLGIVRSNLTTIMGRLVTSEISDDLDYIVLKDVVIVQWQQHDENMVPMGLDYPAPMISSMITSKALEERNEISFLKKDIITYIELEIKDELIGWYDQVMAQKSGIEVVNNESRIITP